MTEKIENLIKVTCDEVDLTTITNIEFYVSQITFFETYEPIVVSPSEMVVKIPFEDAMRLTDGDVSLQFAFTDADGNHRASDIVKTNVSRLLKEDGYDPI